METLTNQHLTIQVSRHGAELCSILCDGKEYLWQADPTFWKRHSPVLFPIVGSLWNGTYCVDGQEYHLPQHGFARDRDFVLLQQTTDSVRYRLTDDEESRLCYPFPFSLEIGYRIEGRKIEVLWQVRNTGGKEMHFQIGAHPAFYYQEPVENGVKGYFGFDCSEGLECTLISEQGCADTGTRYPLQLTDGLLPVGLHTFDRNALILEDRQVNRVTLYTSGKLPLLTLTFDAPLVGLWSPSAEAPFVCIEPWYGRCDRAHYTGECRNRDWMQHLAPGELFETSYTIEIK